MKDKNKIALIIGAGGQDGKLLFDYLSDLNYKIIGFGHKSIRTNGIKFTKKIDINNKIEVLALVKFLKPDEIYYLAAHHHSAQDKKEDLYEEIEESFAVNVLALANFLEAIRLYSKKTRLFYASSSLIFGNCVTKKQNEETPYKPNSLYGLTKMNGLTLCKMYREKYNIFSVSGILYNHESEYRTENFISMKIIKGALAIKSGLKKKIIVGDLSAAVDWGYAHDYVRAMNMILSLKEADDFIIGTGKVHTVLDLVKTTFSYLKLDWKKYVAEDKKLIKEKRAVLIADPAKLKLKTKWQPSVDFAGMIKAIIDKLN